jgi:CelD/BcsL family acetyltransferase involved in cellulose biosynthesis
VNVDIAPESGALRFRTWTVEEFSAAKQSWKELLRRSNANPLFMSWEWQWAWWSHLATETDELCLIAGYSADGKLIGLAPLYLHRALHRGLSACRLESIGSNWRSRTDVFSEYLDFVVDAEYETRFARELAQQLLLDDRWNDLVLRNVREDSVASRMALEHLADASYVRSVEPIEAHAIQLPQSFDDYVASLRPSIRRRVWNCRKRLTGAQLHSIPADRVAPAFERLNRYHLERWGNVQYIGARRDFHLQFAEHMAATGALQLTELNAEAGAMSILYNIRTEGTEYNIQSGFQVGIPGISPGYLHFGYCIERACEEGVQTFDFLAGGGLHRDYKGDFGTVRTSMGTLQVVRSGPLVWMYRQYDKHLAAPIARLRRRSAGSDRRVLPPGH